MMAQLSHNNQYVMPVQIKQTTLQASSKSDIQPALPSMARPRGSNAPAVVLSGLPAAPSNGVTERLAALHTDTTSRSLWAEAVKEATSDAKLVSDTLTRIVMNSPPLYHGGEQRIQSQKSVDSVRKQYEEMEPSDAEQMSQTIGQSLAETELPLTSKLSGLLRSF